MSTTDPLRARADTLVGLFERMGALSRSPAFTRLMQLNLGISHIKALHEIAQAAELTMGDLAGRLAMTPPSVTALVRRLEATGLVERARSTADSRVWLLRLTEEGRQLGQQIREQRSQLMIRLLATLGEDEQRALVELLGRAIGAAEQLIDA